MDFFRSILSDDPEPESPENNEDSDTIQSPKHHETEELDEDDDSISNSISNSNSNSNLYSSEDGAGAGLWSFGDLVKTLTTRSESVFETYRRDLKEFGTGLRKESDLFREVASRAVKELPSSIEVGTSAIDGVFKSTVDFIAIGKDSSDSDSSEKHGSSFNNNRSLNSSNSRSFSRFDSKLNSKSSSFSRFDVELNLIQLDKRTYCEDPEDLEDFRSWKLGFVFGDKREEIEELVGENGVLAGIYLKIVPGEVDDATFWYRYFYKVNKVKLKSDLRDKLVKRSLSSDVEEELSWDIEDEDEEEEEEEDEKRKQKQKFDDLKSDTKKMENLQNVEKQVNLEEEGKKQKYDDLRSSVSKIEDLQNVEKRNLEKEKQKVDDLRWNVSKIEDLQNVEKRNLEEEKQKLDDLRSNPSKIEDLQNVEKRNLEEEEQKNDDLRSNASKIEDLQNVGEQVNLEYKNNIKESEKVDTKMESCTVKNESFKGDDEDEDEDLDWDEIEEDNNEDKKKVNEGEMVKKVDLRKRLINRVDEEEDLSWDIEEDEDDEIVKTSNK